jgi:DNA-binding SARP family transcriptional activator
MLSLRLLGPPEVMLDGESAPAELYWRKHLALLAYLALSPTRGRTREHLVGLLWAEKSEASARHSLREAIRVLRHGLGAEAIVTEGQVVRLALDEVQLDTATFEDCVARKAWDEAVALATGEFLEGFSVPGANALDDWLSAQRMDWRARITQALVQHAEGELRAGHLEGGRRAAGRALAADPLSDVAVRVAMRAEALAGDAAAGLEVFATFARRAREAGVEPGQPTALLAERIRQQRRPERPFRRSRSEPWSRRAPLVGRSAELATLVTEWERVASGTGARLAIVEGDLGIGKTRLLGEVATRASLEGTAVAKALAVWPDREDAGSGMVGLARGGLGDAAGVAAAQAAAHAAFAARIPEWGDRFPGARNAQPITLTSAFRELVMAAAGEQPVLLAVDDAHWLDDDSLGVLHVLLRDARDRRLLVMLTLLPGTTNVALDELRTAVGGDVPGATLKLNRLDAAAVRELAEWALPGYDPEALDRVTRRVTADSAGIPLLAVELLHAVTLGLEPSTEGTSWPAPMRTLSQTLPGDLPDNVVAAIRVGFRGLTPGAQQVLATLAVLPDRAEEALLARATGLAQEDVELALDELEWQRWVTSDARGYAFVARIVKEIVKRDMLTPGQRRRIEEAVRPDEVV